MMPDGSWFWVVEPDDGRHAPPDRVVRAGDGRALTRREHGYPGRVTVVDESGASLPVATLLRAAAAAGRSGRTLEVRLGPAGTAPWAGDGKVVLDGPAVAASASHHPVEAQVARLLAEAPAPRPRLALHPPAPPALPAGRGVPRALFFESLMNTDLPHNDSELSQGVLHMVSPLAGGDTEVVFANVKMSITGLERPVVGMAGLQAALAGGPVGLVCITLLEGYFDGVVALIEELRRLGCRGHVAVGGVMPTLTPEHVAAHLPGVSFVCRGAGEHFVPRLARILGLSASVDEPFTDAQVEALLAVDGLIAIDRAGRRLLSANPGRMVEVDSLDRVPLDLSRLAPRHLVHGIEISTSRGCIHKCAFCSIIGRQTYQARSAENVLALLDRYHDHFRRVFGENIPANAFRVHISDDDFACDRERAAEFFRSIAATPFRLSSVQVSIADLCRKDGQRLLPEPDRELLDTILPECFADAGAPVPERDFVVDHRTRSWSAYLAIGIESFSDAELVRLAKGYRVEHVLAVVGELARRDLHVDSYFILSNSETRPADLVDALEEVARLKLRHARTFHIRFPIVPRLVSYFSSASYRRLLRQGKGDALALRRVARVEGHPEFDYPFVQHDEPRDPWVRAAVEADVFTDAGCYTGSLDRLREVWRSPARGPLDRAQERLLRRLDDRPRRLVFEVLSDAMGSGRGETDAMRVALDVLGPVDGWKRAFRRWRRREQPRLVVIPTWQCELRCKYCWIPKQDGRVMSRATVERAIDLLLTSSQQAVTLQFFGGEALMEYDLVRHAIEHGQAAAGEAGKSIGFILSTNGWSLDPEKLDWLRRHPVKLELSLDGTPETQRVFRVAHDPCLDSYERSIASRASEILASGLPYDVIMVVHPANVDNLARDFFHIAGLGFTRIQINHALGLKWTPRQTQVFEEQLGEIGRELARRWAAGERLAVVNLEAEPGTIRLNGEITVDHDGTIYGGNGFLPAMARPEDFRLGHLDDLGCFDRYWLDMPTNRYLLEKTYSAAVTANNLGVAEAMARFVRAMRTAPLPTSAGHGR